MTGSDTAPAAAANPYVGPRPLDGSRMLYGRDDEVRELYHLLSGERIVVLHSPSGAGKSSLLRAGLIPRLEGERFDLWRPIRVNHAPPDGLNSRGNRYVLSTLLSLEEELPVDRRRSAESLAGMRLADYIANRPRRRNAPPSTLLTFDQFEEILTVDELAVEAKEEFFDQVGEALCNERVFALFALREDYLAPLLPYAPRVPTQLRNRYRLGLLGLEAARAAIAEPARAAGRPFAEGVAAQLARDLATVKVQGTGGEIEEVVGKHVEPVQLQVVCRRLWEHLPADAKLIDKQDVESVGDVDEALGNYYDDEVARIAGGTGEVAVARERSIRDWFRTELITDTGIRGQLLREPGRSGGLDNETIDRLLDTHLIRSEERAGKVWLELAHDRLLAAVGSSNTLWLDAHLQPLQRQAELWDLHGRPRSSLMREDALRAAERWAADNDAILLEREREYLERSVERRRDERRVRIAKIGMFVGVVGSTLLLFHLFLTAKTQYRRARASGLAIAASHAIQEDDGQRALLFSLEAAKAPESDPDRVNQVLLHALTLAPQRVVFVGHERAVVAARVSPDGTRVVTGSWDNTARLWDLDGNQLAVIPAATKQVRNVLFSPDGSRILVVGAHGHVALADPAGKLLSSWECGRPAGGPAAFAPDGTWIATASDELLELWDLGGQRLASSGGHAGAILAVTVSPDGSEVLTASMDGTARVWAVGADLSLSQLHELPAGSMGLPVVDARYSAKGESIVTASWDHTARRWSRDSEPLQTFTEHTHRLLAVTMAPTGTSLVSTSLDGTAIVYRTSGEPPVLLRNQDATITTAAFSPDGQRVVTGSTSGRTRVWSLDGRVQVEVRGHAELVTTATFTPDGRHVLTASFDGTAQLWPADGGGRGIISASDLGGLVRRARFSPDGRRLLTAGSDGTARIWDEDGRKLAELRGHRSALLEAKWAPAGATVLTASIDGTARVWRADGTQLETLQHGSPVLSASFSADGKRVATAGLKGTARVWERDGTELVRVSLPNAGPIASVALSPDGERLLTAHADSRARLWSLAGDNVATLVGHDAAVTGAAFSPDGTRIATSGDDHQILLWTADGERILERLQAHHAAVRTVEWSVDGDRLISTSADHTARIWRADKGTSLLRLGISSQSVVFAALSPDGTRAVAALTDGRVMIGPISQNALVSMASARVYRGFTAKESAHFTDLFGERLPTLAPPGVTIQNRSADD